MRGDQFGHLKHIDFAFAAKNRLQFVVGDDIALVGRVLEVVLLNVRPQLLYDLSTGHWALAYDRLEFFRKI